MITLLMHFNKSQNSTKQEKWTEEKGKKIFMLQKNIKLFHYVQIKVLNGRDL